MSMFHLIFFIWVLLTSSLSLVLGSVSWFHRQTPKQLEQRTDRFWGFSHETRTWVELDLPYDLVACVNQTCTKVGSITGTRPPPKKEHAVSVSVTGLLGQRKRVSLTKMSETSVWVTGESGSIYERFWNGLHWVLAPHDLPTPLEHAISVYIVNHTILALSESGNLYKMQLSESSQPIWVIFMPPTTLDYQASIKSGVVSQHQGGRVYFCTKNGSLLELSDSEVDPPRWLNHGQPPGANVAAIADAGTLRPDVIYTISSVGDLYEHDPRSKPSWKKHVWRDRASLQPSKGSTHSTSLFLLTKDGKLVERKLEKRKWKWIVHGKPKDHHLTSVTRAQQDDSLFLTSSSGSVFEYRKSKKAGNHDRHDQKKETWISHAHPLNAKAARGVAGLELQPGRLLFALDDGRLAELHLPGIGGESSGPMTSIRRKSATKYVWTVLDAPETEGWNGEYCSEERGPANCIAGIRDEPSDPGSTMMRQVMRRKKGSTQQDYALLPSGEKTQSSLDEYSYSENWLWSNFRLRAMQGGRSFFLVADGGFVFEHLYTESAWIWLRHDHPTAIGAAVGNYNGSLYVIDEYGSLLIRERSGNNLAWINCTAMRRGKKVTGGSPWDGIPGRAMKVTAEDSLFFVGNNGRLLQFIVVLRKFKWKDCKSPPGTKVACIVDAELFRENVVFVVGANGRLYQYNKVSELWHEHYQSRHLVLSRLPGTAMRPPSPATLAGSVFMLSEDGGLVEYHWNSMDGWNWVEHGSPHKGVALGSVGPSFEGKQLFSIGSDGNVYMRYMDQMTWKWKNCSFPRAFAGNEDDQQEFCVGEDFTGNSEVHENTKYINSNNCDPKIASIRPIPFSEDSVMFELRDRRIAELKRIEGNNWAWSRTIGTPTSLCTENHWTALAS